MSNEIIKAPVQSTNPDAVGALGADTLPASTPEYAPAAQVFVENVAEQGTEEEKRRRGEEERDASGAAKTPDAPPSALADASLPQQAYDLMVQFVSRDPRFELNNNVRQVLAEVQHLRMAATDKPAADSDLVMIRETVQHIWTHLQSEGTGNKEQGVEGAAIAAPANAPTAELINETRTLVRSVNEEVNATRNTTIQMTNQMRIAMDVTTRCLREMDKTARKYEQQIERQAEQQTEQYAVGRDGEHGEIIALLDELHSLRDMLADGFENARLEPIAPEPGEAYRYNEHRADNGFTAGGKIKRTLFAGFRWTQPTPPVVLLPAIVETE